MTSELLKISGPFFRFSSVKTVRFLVRNGRASGCSRHGWQTVIWKWCPTPRGALRHLVERCAGLAQHMRTGKATNARTHRAVLQIDFAATFSMR